MRIYLIGLNMWLAFRVITLKENKLQKKVNFSTHEFLISFRVIILLLFQNNEWGWLVGLCIIGNLITTLSVKQNVLWHISSTAVKRSHIKPSITLFSLKRSWQILSFTKVWKGLGTNTNVTISYIPRSINVMKIQIVTYETFI